MLGVVGVDALGEKDVAGFDVAVDQPVGVRRVQRRGDLGADPAGRLQGERAVPVQEPAQVLAAYVPHRDVQDAVGLAGLEDRDDVRVVDGGRGLRLPFEPAAEDVVAGQFGGEQLERDRAVQAQVTGAVDDGHAAAPDLVLDPVAGDPVPGHAGGPARDRFGVPAGHGWSVRVGCQAAGRVGAGAWPDGSAAAGPPDGSPVTA